MKESEIRDYLSKHLDILAPNLEMIGTPEHHLKNPNGSAGFIDLLTRNRLNNVYVPIELKKSRQTARQAINEVFKYVALLQEQYKLQNHEIAPIVASTDWQDLLTPFSEFKRVVPYDVIGLRLLVDANGFPVATEEILSLPEREGITICPQHAIFLFDKEADRDAALPNFIELISQSRIEDYVVIRMNYTGNNRAVIYPFALYFAMAGLQTNRKLSIKGELEQNEEWHDEFDEFEWWFEDYLQNLLLPKMLDLPYKIDIEVSEPFKFSQMVSLWQVKEIHRGGSALSHKDIRTDQDILLALASFATNNPFYFAASSNPSLENHWRKFRQDLDRSIDSNEKLSALVNKFLDELSPTSNRDVVVLVQFRNSIVMDICATHKEHSTRLPFMLEIRILPNETEPPRVVLASVCWDGVTFPDNPSAKFEEFFDDINMMIWAQQMGDVEHEDDLLTWLGLSYQLFEVVYELEKLPLVFHLESVATGLERIEAQAISLQPYSVFVTQNSEFLDELVAVIMANYFDMTERLNPPDDELIGTNEWVVGWIDISQALLDKFGNFLRQDITSVRIAQSIRYVWLETTVPSPENSDETISRMELNFIVQGQLPIFSPFYDLETNAGNFLRLDAYSLMMTTDLFNEDACCEIDALFNKNNPNASE